MYFVKKRQGEFNFYEVIIGWKAFSYIVFCDTMGFNSNAVKLNNS